MVTGFLVTRILPPLFTFTLPRFVAIIRLQFWVLPANTAGWFTFRHISGPRHTGSMHWFMWRLPSLCVATSAIALDILPQHFCCDVPACLRHAYLTHCRFPTTVVAAHSYPQTHTPPDYPLGWFVYVCLLLLNLVQFAHPPSLPLGVPFALPTPLYTWVLSAVLQTVPVTVVYFGGALSFLRPLPHL